jgi:hypothetical protein
MVISPKLVCAPIPNFRPVLYRIGALPDPTTLTMLFTKSLALEDSVTLVACIILHRLCREVPSLTVCLMPSTDFV